MFQNAKNIRFYYAETGKCSKKHTVSSRKSYGIYYKVDGESRYHFPDREITFSPGSLLYIPEGAAYSFERSSEGPSRFMLVAFRADSGMPQEPIQIPLKPNSEIPGLYYRLAHTYRKGTAADKLKCSSFMFKIFSVIQKEYSLLTSDKDTEVLAPALKRLNEGLYDPALKISELHTLCNLSAPAFRRLFIKVFQIMPKEYLTQKRMQEARRILENGDHDSIAQVALQVGFEDPLYFSKCFRAHFGAPPSKFTTQKLFVPTPRKR